MPDPKGYTSPKITDSMPKRIKVLGETVQLEFLTSTLLTQLLHLKEETITFGHTTKALSFDQKLNLLMDIGMLEKEQRLRFTLLQEMRNQFAHSLTAFTFEICVGRTSIGKEKLFKWHPQDTSLPIEEQLEKAFDDLIAYIRKVVKQIVSDALVRWQDDHEKKLNQGGLNNYLEKRFDIFNVHRIEANRRAMREETFTADEVNDILRHILEKSNEAIERGFDASNPPIVVN